MFLFDQVVPAAVIVAGLGFARTLAVALIAAHLSRNSEDPKVLERFAKVVKATRIRWPIRR